LFVEGEGDGRPFTYVMQPAILDAASSAAPAQAPELGEHNAQLLAELGYSATAIAELARLGVTSAAQMKDHMSSAIYRDA
jgi:formyl-CoA transferase